MCRYLIVYSTQEGQTAKIVRFISNELQMYADTSVDVYSETEVPIDLDLSRYDGVMIGASVHLGQFPKELVQWVKANSEILSMSENGFFSVCLGILEAQNKKTQDAERKIVFDFFRETGWHPRHWRIFAGALRYTKYGPFKKLLMKILAGRAGGDVDTSRDYEYTDWTAVRRFTSEFRAATELRDLKLKTRLTSVPDETKYYRSHSI